MCDSIRTQLLKLNLGYEVLIEQFVKNMLAFPGCFVAVPMPIHKGQTVDAWNDEKQEICNRTSELLTMIGIKHQQSVTQYQMMVEDPQ